MNTSIQHFRRLMLALLAMHFVAAAQAADIELRATARPTNGMVRLGDIAIIHSDSAAEAEALERIEMIPTPATGRARSLRLRDVQDLLTLQGVNLVQHQFCGATQVQVGGGESTAVKASSTAYRTIPAVKVAKSQAAQAEARVQAAIVQHLRDHAEAQASWQVDFALSPEQVATLSTRIGDVIVAGGAAPWTGEQDFSLTVRTEQGHAKLPITAEVSLPDRIVITRRTLRRGEILQVVDLELALPPLGSDPAVAITSLEDAIGRETTHSIGTGQPLEAAWLRKPLLVKRGEVVTVFARNSNITVRTNARAVEDGGQGDVVTVERLDDRQRFAARVIGVQELEVFVSSVNVSNRK